MPGPTLSAEVAGASPSWPNQYSGSHDCRVSAFAMPVPTFQIGRIQVCGNEVANVTLPPFLGLVDEVPDDCLLVRDAASVRAPARSTAAADHLIRRELRIVPPHGAYPVVAAAEGPSSALASRAWSRS